MKTIKKPLKRVSKRTPKKTPKKTPRKNEPKPQQPPKPNKVRQVLVKAQAVQQLQERGDEINNEVDVAMEIQEEEQNKYKQLYEAEQYQTEQLRSTIASLRKRIEAYENRSSETLSGTVSIPKDTLEGMALCTTNPNVFGRALLQHIFTDEEMRGKSFSGKECNANDEPPKPAIDKERGNAILRETLKIYGRGKDREQKKPILKDLGTSLGSKVSEINRRLARHPRVVAGAGDGSDDDNDDLFN